MFRDPPWTIVDIANLIALQSGTKRSAEEVAQREKRLFWPAIFSEHDASEAGKDARNDAGAREQRTLKRPASNPRICLPQAPLHSRRSTGLCPVNSRSVQATILLSPSELPL